MYHFRRRYIRIIALPLSLAMLTSACASNPDGSTPDIFTDIGAVFGSGDADLTPEQAALREQEDEYSESRLESAAVGVALGVGVGALVGALIGGRQGAVAGAVLGGVAGGAAGYVGGTYLTRDHSEFVASRDTLQKDIDAAKADSQKMQRNVEVAESALSAQRTMLNQVNADLRAGRINEEQARARVKTASEDVASVRALAEESERRVTNLNQSVASYLQAGLPTADLNRELKVQKERAARLRRVEQSMVSAIAKTPPNIRPAVS